MRNVIKRCASEEGQQWKEKKKWRKPDQGRTFRKGRIQIDERKRKRVKGGSREASKNRGGSQYNNVIWIPEFDYMGCSKLL